MTYTGDTCLHTEMKRHERKDASRNEDTTLQDNRLNFKLKSSLVKYG